MGSWGAPQAPTFGLWQTISVLPVNILCGMPGISNSVPDIHMSKTNFLKSVLGFSKGKINYNFEGGGSDLKVIKITFFLIFKFFYNLLTRHF